MFFRSKMFFRKIYNRTKPFLIDFKNYFWKKFLMFLPGGFSSTSKSFWSSSWRNVLVNQHRKSGSKSDSNDRMPLEQLHLDALQQGSTDCPRLKLGLYSRLPPAAIFSAAAHSSSSTFTLLFSLWRTHPICMMGRSSRMIVINLCWPSTTSCHSSSSVLTSTPINFPSGARALSSLWFQMSEMRQWTSVSVHEYGRW